MKSQWVVCHQLDSVQLINQMYGYDSWTIKKAEHRRIDDFKLWCWRRLLRVPWTERRSNQSILKQINLEYEANQPWIFIGRTDAEDEAPCFVHLMWRTDSLEKTLMLGKTEGRSRRGSQKIRWLDGITDNGHEFEQALGDGEGQASLACCSPWGGKELDMTEWLNWTECI